MTPATSHSTSLAATSPAEREAQFLAALVQIPPDQFADVLGELAAIAERHARLND